MTTLDHGTLLDIRRQIAPYIHETPLWHSATLSRMSGFNVYLKAELLQKTGSYKPRGMLWAVMSLTPEQRARGVITFSSGNAAQGLAYAGSIFGVAVTVAMPAQANPAKAQATRDYGAQVLLHGTLQECREFCRQYADDHGLTFVPAYDDVTLMRGHATLGLELLESEEDIDAIILGVGGGGMLGGVALALEACGSHADLIGVEPTGAAAMHLSLARKGAVSLDVVNTIADGLAAPSAGTHCVEVALRRVREIALVSDEEIVAALRVIMERCKLYAEPAGAAAVASLLSGRISLPPRSKVVCVVSGGNLDLQRLKGLL